MSDRITDSRQRLHTALSPLLPEGRVSKYVPKQVVTPTIWIERHSWSPTREGSVNLILLSWRIVVATDADKEQAQLDELSSLVHDAAVAAKFRPAFADHQPVDVGGASTTALVVTVTDSIAPATLCLPHVVTPVERLAPV